MRADWLIVQVCEFLDVGDGVYRFHAPSAALARLPGVVSIDIGLHHRLLPELARRADVLILAGFDNDWFALLEQRRREGKLSILEANDYYWDLQMWNPLSARWTDRALQDTFRHGLLACDGVQASTPELAARWREITPRPVTHFANQLETIPPFPSRPGNRPLTIGWGGSPGHFADWYALSAGLQRWLEAHPDVHLAIMCHEFAKEFLRLEGARYHFTPFGSLQDYSRFLTTLDIGLAPLLPSDYNRCRSDVKYLEYASHGVTGIYADLEPYRQAVSDGETGLFYRSPEDLWRQLDRLVEDVALRERIARRAYEVVATTRKLDDHIGKRLQWYEALLGQKPSGNEVPAEVLQQATGTGRYLRVPVGSAETEFVRLLALKADQETVLRLESLVGRNPGYGEAWHLLGRHYNDLRRDADALRCLERARVLDPLSAKGLAEIARVHFLAGNTSEARRLLEEAVGLNPYSTPAWQYLLRLLEVTRSADAGKWLKEARKQQPANYPLALLGLAALPPEEAAGVLEELLDTYPPTLTSEEMPGAAAAFSEVIGTVLGPVLTQPEGLLLLARACQEFPLSGRLSALHAEALHRAGQEEESQREWIRMAALRRTALTWKAEWPREDRTIHFGQFAEHIQRFTAES